MIDNKPKGTHESDLSEIDTKSASRRLITTYYPANYSTNQSMHYITTSRRLTRSARKNWKNRNSATDEAEAHVALENMMLSNENEKTVENPGI